MLVSGRVATRAAALAEAAFVFLERELRAAGEVRPGAAQEQLDQLAVPLAAPRQAEPGIDSHWDFVLKEGGWMSQDFKDERTRLKKKRKAIVHAIKRYHSKQQARVLELRRKNEQRRRRRAGAIAGHVARWWRSVDRLIVYKHESRLDALRRDALERRLDSLVAETRGYASRLADGVAAGEAEAGAEADGVGEVSGRNKNKGKGKDKGEGKGEVEGAGSAAPSASRGIASGDDSPLENGRGHGDDEVDEAELMRAPDAVDDEATLEEEEGAGAEAGVLTGREEEDALTREGDMPIEELMAMYSMERGGDVEEDEDEDEGEDDTENDVPRVDAVGIARGSRKSSRGGSGGVRSRASSEAGLADEAPGNNVLVVAAGRRVNAKGAVHDVDEDKGENENKGEDKSA